MFSVITKYHKGRHSLFLYNSEIFYAFTQDILRSPKYICGINEYMTQQNLIDLGLNESSTLKKVYETAHAIQQAIHNRDGESLTSILKNYIPMGNAMDTAISTLKKNRSSVVASCSSAFSNGAIEGINRKIKTLKRACYGFTNMSHFRTRILLIVK